MASPAIGFTLRACAAAVGCAFSLGASAQSVEAAMNAARAGLERAIKPPLEVIWLEAEVQDKMWRDPSLAHVLQGCTRTGAPKEGCAVTVRSAWRYTVDASSAVRPAALTISSHLRQAPSGSARINLTGSGRVYIVTPHASGTGALRPPSGAILLAAGTAVQLVDTAFPSIQVEIKAPEDEGLFLGNLAESDVTKVVALLVKQPGLVSASAANILETGKVALRAPTPGAASMQLAAAVRARPRAEIATDLSALAGILEIPAESEPLPSGDFSLLAAAVETSAPLPASFAVASVDLSPLAGKLDMPIRDSARAAPAPALALDLTPLVAAMERAEPLPAPVAIASVDFTSVAGRLEMPIRDVPRLAAGPQPVTAPAEVALVAAALEQATALPAPIAPVRADPVTAPVQVALASPAPAPAADLAKMRAEIEAEIARERERMAQSLQGRSAPRFRFGT